MYVHYEKRFELIFLAQKYILSSVLFAANLANVLMLIVGSSISHRHSLLNISQYAPVRIHDNALYFVYSRISIQSLLKNANTIVTNMYVCS